MLGQCAANVRQLVDATPSARWRASAEPRPFPCQRALPSVCPPTEPARGPTPKQQLENADQSQERGRAGDVSFLSGPPSARPMPHVLLLASSLLLAACASAGLPTPVAVPDRDDGATAFVNVTVIPMDAERQLVDHTVVVQGDRIVEVGPSASVEVPEGATVVDGRGRYLAPGLAEMHGHVPPPSAPAELTEETLFLYLSQGITTVRGMLGAPGQLDLRARANARRDPLTDALPRRPELPRPDRLVSRAGGCDGARAARRGLGPAQDPPRPDRAPSTTRSPRPHASWGCASAATSRRTSGSVTRSHWARRRSTTSTATRPRSASPTKRSTATSWRTSSR